MGKNIKRIDIKEFREKGYLQELNRNFLHPLGLALEVVIDGKGNETLGGIWDYREDNEGMFYDIKNRDSEVIEAFKIRAKFIENEFEIRRTSRENLFNGLIIEPLEKPM